MFKSHFKFLAVAIVAAILIPSCKSQYESLLNSNDLDEKYEAAFDFFNHGKYNKAAQLFESLSVLTSNTSRSDTVQYYWGLSNYRFKDYYTAETNFVKFLTDYPYSTFAPEAAFLRIDCLYRSCLRYELDQTPTRNAISTVSQYLIENPSSSHGPLCRQMLDDLNGRIDKKQYENAKLYYKMEDYKASRVAFKNILKDNSENRYREDILYFTAMSSYKYAQLSVESKQKERYLTFIDDYFNFIGEIPESNYKKELDLMYRRAQKALGRYTGSEEDLEAKEKDFSRENKKIMKQLPDSTAYNK